MLTSFAMLMASIAAHSIPVRVDGVAPVRNITVEASSASISTLRLPKGENIVDIAVSDPTALQTRVVSDRIVAVTGDPGAAGTCWSGGRPAIPSTSISSARAGMPRPA
jgi:hypothetical protein